MDPEHSDTLRIADGAGIVPPSMTIVATNLSKQFAGGGGEVIKAVDGVSFTCAPSQFVAITGPSGCGKTTLMYLLGGLEQPTRGQLLVGGVDVTRLGGAEANRFRRRKVGFVFQSYYLIPNLTALENVMLPMQLAGTAGGRRRACGRAHALLTQVGIEEARHAHRPGKLSGGQQQRVAIARALANDPSVILADEPTGNLDTQTSERIVGLLRQLAHQGRTVVMVTHDVSIAEQADQRIALDDGHIVGHASERVD